MIWHEERLKEIQRYEDKIFASKKRQQKTDAFTSMESATHSYVKDTKPKSEPAEVNFIGRSTYSHSGKLIGFYLEPLNKKKK